jgi:hypothetical protein
MNKTPIDHRSPEDQEMAKWAAISSTVKLIAISSTVLYLVLFPFVCYFALISVLMTIDKTHFLKWSNLIYILVNLLSIPISIYFIWSRYLLKQYKKTYFFCVLPLITFLVVSFVLRGLLVLFRYIGIDCFD